MNVSFQYRGMVLCPYTCSDVRTSDWPYFAKAAGLNLLGIHNGGGDEHARRADLHIAACGANQRDGLARRTMEAGLDVEYELHAMSTLLPRSEFRRNPSWFLHDYWQGKRIPDFNFCPHSRPAMERVALNARRLGRRYHPTTGRYFLWSDDGRYWCHCEHCRSLSNSDQELTVMNALLKANRRDQADARLAYLAFMGTMDPPSAVKPAAGVFLEYAPYKRCFRHSIDDPHCSVNLRNWNALLRLLKVFDPRECHVLEYWLDELYIGKNKEVVVPVMRKDLRAYAGLGIRSVTSFATFDPKQRLGRKDLQAIRRYGEAVSAV
ncbi:MAG: DUF4838 domain-containing protein [Lentisphaerae bacterium]|nr:DUF4838 domain-containing protein [Lentisphaerota bacterium]